MNHLILLISVIGIAAATTCMEEDNNMFENCEKDVCCCIKKIVEIVC